MIAADSGYVQSERLPSIRDFTAAERALLVYGLGLAAVGADPDVLRGALSDIKYYRIDLEVNGGVGFMVCRSKAGAPPPTSIDEVSQGASVNLSGAFDAIARVIAADSGYVQSERLPSIRDFTAAERALLVYGLGLAAVGADPDVLRGALRTLGVSVADGVLGGHTPSKATSNDS